MLSRSELNKRQTWTEVSNRRLVVNAHVSERMREKRVHFTVSSVQREEHAEQEYCRYQLDLQACTAQCHFHIPEKVLFHFQIVGMLPRWKNKKKKLNKFKKKLIENWNISNFSDALFSLFCFFCSVGCFVTRKRTPSNEWHFSVCFLFKRSFMNELVKKQTNGAMNKRHFSWKTKSVSTTWRR